MKRKNPIQDDKENPGTSKRSLSEKEKKFAQKKAPSKADIRKFFESSQESQSLSSEQESMPQDNSSLTDADQSLSRVNDDSEEDSDENDDKPDEESDSYDEYDPLLDFGRLDSPLRYDNEIESDVSENEMDSNVANENGENNEQQEVSQRFFVFLWDEIYVKKLTVLKVFQSPRSCVKSILGN